MNTTTETDTVSAFFNEIETAFPGINDKMFSRVCAGIHEAVGIDTHDAFHEIRTVIAQCMSEAVNSEEGSAIGSVGSTAFVTAIQMYIIGRFHEIRRSAPAHMGKHEADLASLLALSTHMREQVSVLRDLVETIIASTMVDLIKISKDQDE